MSDPKIVSLHIGDRISGVAGQYGYRATVTYSDGEKYPSLFTSSAYGGSVFIGLTRIDSAVTLRCGRVLSPTFIRRFYGLTEEN